MKRAKSQTGFTIIEVLVAMSLFAVLAVGFYQVMFASTRNSDQTTSIAHVSEEARLGFNRMVRDTREADTIESADPNTYNVKVDFNRDGSFDNPNPAGDYEDLTFRFVASDKVITLNGEPLVRGVEKITGLDVFQYSSNFLTYDWNADGVTTWQELDVAGSHGISGVGDSNGSLSAGEFPYISSVTYSFRVSENSRSAEFYGEAQIRNKR